MGLLNYTTKIDADKTAQEIAKCLSMHGAKAVLTDFEDGIVSAISFKIEKDGKRRPCFRFNPNKKNYIRSFAILTRTSNLKIKHG